MREIGALVDVLGGFDLLIFTAGVGEHSEELRARICGDLDFLGIKLDPTANLAHGPLISVPANDEWIAARHAAALISIAEEKRSGSCR